MDISQFFVYADKLDELEKAKYVEPEKRLAYLNFALNNGLAKSLKVLYNASFIKKCSYSFLGYGNIQNIYLKGNYGHLVLDDKFFRISTCINIKNGLLKIPVKEKKYWNDNTYICWTKNNLFLSIKTSELCKLTFRNDDFENYEFNLFEILSHKDVCYYGYYNNDTLDSSIKKINLKNISLPDNFKSISIKGCTSFNKFNYALLSLDDNHIEYYSTIESIMNMYQYTHTCQYLSKIARLNSNILNNSYSKNNFYNYLIDCKTIYLNNKEFIIVSLKYLPKKESTLKDILKDCLNKSSILEENNYIIKNKNIDETQALKYIEIKTKKKPSNIYIVKKLFNNYSMINCDQALELNQIKFL